MSEAKHWDADENYVVDLNTSEVLFQAVYAQEDDMRMASAAPELLEALQRLKTEIILSDVDMDYIESHFRPWLDKARAAISKATGE
jgi:hypothetical protein